MGVTDEHYWPKLTNVALKTHHMFQFCVYTYVHVFLNFNAYSFKNILKENMLRERLDEEEVRRGMEIKGLEEHVCNLELH